MLKMVKIQIDLDNKYNEILNKISKKNLRSKKNELKLIVQNAIEERAKNLNLENQNNNNEDNNILIDLTNPFIIKNK